MSYTAFAINNKGKVRALAVAITKERSKVYTEAGRRMGLGAK